jgi:hypothetical protein
MNAGSGVTNYRTGISCAESMVKEMEVSCSNNRSQDEVQ